MMVVYAILLGVATFIEKYHGTEAANMLFYHSPVFFLLNILLIGNFIGISIIHKHFKKKKYGYMICHLGLIVILLGASVTHFFGEEWSMHLRQGHESSLLISKDKKTLGELPFTVTLKDFHIERYPCSHSPSSYESLLVFKTTPNENSVEKLLYMNHVIDFQGYRFFQASYDEDEMGSILAINKDVAGRNITYFGYLLLAIGLLLCIFVGNNRFTYLYKQLDRKTNKNFVAILFVGLCLLSSNSFTLSAINGEKVNLDEHLKIFGELPMLSNKGRIEPINTFASEICRKLHVRLSENKRPEYFIYQIITEPTKMAYMPLIHVKDKELRRICGGEEYISYRDVFDEAGQYKYALEIENAYRKGQGGRSHLDNEWMKLDEKVNILHQLFNFKLLKIFPATAKTWYAPGDDFEANLIDSKDSTTIISLFKDYREALIPRIGSKLEDNRNLELKNRATIDTKFKNQKLDFTAANEILKQIREYQETKLAKFTSSSCSHVINEQKIEGEAMYNRLNLIAHCKRGYLILGFLLLLISFSLIIKSPSPSSSATYSHNISESSTQVLTQNRTSFLNVSRDKFEKWTKIIGVSLVAILLVLHTTSLGMRWYVSGHAPWSNSYETMEFLAWTVIVTALFLSTKSLPAFSLSTLLAGVVLFVSSLSWMNPEITPLVPVLKSPWLMFHVATIMTAYGLLGVNAIGSAASLIMTGLIKEENKTTINKLTIINELVMILGLVFIMIGIFLGAVWANESWGNYWSWDPKETWALITAITYATVFHIRIFEKKKNYLRFNILALLSFGTILMTYFGVNYLLSGMHSYGNTTGLSGASLWVLIGIGSFFIIPIAIALISNKLHK